MASDYYPSNLRFVMNQLSGFSRMRNKLTLPFTKGKANDIIFFKLPSNTLIDLSTLSFNFKISTAGTGGYVLPPQYAACLIEQLSVDINGINVQTINHYNHLYKQLAQIQSGDQKNRSGFNEFIGIAPTTAATLCNKLSLSIKQFLGILGSNKIIDTSVLGEITVSMRLASNACLSATATSGISYELENMSVQFDSVNLDNPVYQQSMYRQLENGGLKWCFSNYIANIGGAAGFPLSQTFSVSTQSLDFLYGIILQENYNTVGNTAGNLYEATINSSSYFKHGAAYIDSAQYQIGTVSLPNFLPSLSEQLSFSLDSLGLSNDILGTCNDSFKPKEIGTETDLSDNHHYENFVKSNYCFVARLCHGQKDPVLLSGLSTQGTNTMISVRYTAPTTTTGNYIPLTWAVCTSTLTIGSSRQIALTM